MTSLSKSERQSPTRTGWRMPKTSRRQIMRSPKVTVTLPSPPCIGAAMYRRTTSAFTKIITAAQRVCSRISTPIDPSIVPNQEVFFKGILRTNDDLHYSLPKQKQVHVVVEQWGNKIFAEYVPVNEQGSFSGTVKLAQDVSLGSLHHLRLSNHPPHPKDRSVRSDSTSRNTRSLNSKSASRPINQPSSRADRSTLGWMPNIILAEF